MGDDWAFYEDDTDLASGIVDGQTGDDTIDFSADAITLAGLGAAHIGVENLVLSNVDLEDEVTIIFSFDPTTGATGTALAEERDSESHADREYPTSPPR